MVIIWSDSNQAYYVLEYELEGDTDTFLILREKCDQKWLGLRQYLLNQEDLSLKSISILTEIKYLSVLESKWGCDSRQYYMVHRGFACKNEWHSDSREAIKCFEVKMRVWFRQYLWNQEDLCLKLSSNLTEISHLIVYESEWTQNLYLLRYFNDCLLFLISKIYKENMLYIV